MNKEELHKAAKDKLIKTQKEYIKLLSDELDDVVPGAALMGWSSHRVEDGIKLRKEMDELLKQLEERYE